MVDTKPWYMSRTIWAALVSISASLGSLIGFDSTEVLRTELTDTILQLVAAIAGVTAIFGRVNARSTIN